MAEECLLRLERVTKSYSGVTVLKDIDLEFKAGEVHTLLGENGAGKSTLIKIISGAIEPDYGKITFAGKEYSRMTPNLADSIGIQVIYQEFNLASGLSVAENIFMGHQIRRGLVIDRKEMAKRTVEIFERFGIPIEPNTVVKNLSVAYMQLVEIAKAVSKNMRCLILDEPTAPLTDKETTVLFDLIQRLKEQNVLIIFISHRMEELFMISDRVTVLRDGEKIITTPIADVTRPKLIDYMVGRELSETFPSRKAEAGEVVLEAQNLNGNGLTDISFTLRKGEILGFGGLVGAGRSELVRLIFGADKLESGKLFLNGEQVEIKSPSAAIKKGIGFITEDRKIQGLILRFSTLQNISLPILRRLSKLLVLSKRKERNLAKREIDELSIKVFSPDQVVETLSGGNQQKVVLAKWLATEADILILDEPTRGIDVGTKQEIYQLMNDLTARGKSLILISSEMPELLGLSDRIIVLCEGRVAGELERDEFDQRKVLDLAMYNRGEKA